jgi:hypothetical protein
MPIRYWPIFGVPECRGKGLDECGKGENGFDEEWAPDPAWPSLALGCSSDSSDDDDCSGRNYLMVSHPFPSHRGRYHGDNASKLIVDAGARDVRR